jgi:DNA-3-methyladenine glycosylase
VTRLSPAFFERDTLQVAKDLLGCRLVRIDDGQRLSGLIVEAEAYIGEDDRACHAARGRTPRTRVMYGLPGRSYVYFVYGMYHCLNVVTEREGFPAAVLIRALEPQEGFEVMRRRRGGRPDRELTNGPGKLCQALGIDARLNGVDLTVHDRLYLERGEPVPPEQIAVSPRVGINVQGWAADVPWRAFVAGSPFVSGYRSHNRKRSDRR